MINDFKDCVYQKYTYIFYSSYRIKVNKPRSLLYKLSSFFIRMLERIIKLEFAYPYLGTIFYFEPSLNNIKTLKGTKKNITTDLLSSCQDVSMFFPSAWVYIYSFIHIFSFLKYYKSLNKEDSELVRYFFHEFFLSMGYYVVVNKSLKRNPQLKAIVMANDHVVVAMCLKDLAKRYGIKTIYTQHASITERFPCLNFDYSFLDGLESLEKYEKIGNIRGNVYLSGSPRFDELYTMTPKKNKGNRIGVAINSLDNLLKVKILCSELIEKGYDDLLLRPHPAIEKTVDWEPFAKMGVRFSLPSKETSFPFLNRISCLISNESGIHLDAAMLGIPSILYNLSDFGLLDWYGFVRTGLIPLAETNKDMLSFLKIHKEVNDDLVQYYVASHKTHLQGKVGEVIGEYLCTIINDKSTDELDRLYFTMHDDAYFVIRN